MMSKDKQIENSKMSIANLDRQNKELTLKLKAAKKKVQSIEESNMAIHRSAHDTIKKYFLTFCSYGIHSFF